MTQADPQNETVGMAPPLRFGLFLGPHHAMDEDPTLAISRDLELVELMDSLGFYEAWIGEHHSGGFEIIASPELFIAAAAERTKYVRLGTGVKSLTFHHPFIVADTMVQLDHMTRGRAMFGVGPGALASDAYMMGVDPADQRRRMTESLDAIVPLLRGETVTAETDWFQLKDACLHLAPYTKPMMEMAVTSVASPSGAIAAGKHGLGLLVLGGISEDALARQLGNWRICEDVAAEHGQTVDRADWRITVMMHLAESREQALADLAYGFQKWVDYSHSVLPASPFPEGLDDTLTWAIDNKVLLVGTPEDAIQEIERVREVTGGFGGWLIFGHNFAPWAETQRSYELFARYVMPHFSEAREAQRASYQFVKERHEGFVGQVSDAVSSAKTDYETKSS